MKTQQKKKPLEDPQYRIPQWALDAAIEGLDELALQLEDLLDELDELAGLTEERS